MPTSLSADSRETHVFHSVARTLAGRGQREACRRLPASFERQAAPGGEAEARRVLGVECGGVYSIQ